MSWIEHYSKSKPLKPLGGIRLKKEVSAISETWWGKRWLSTLEKYGWHTRLDRGKRYARQGQVISLHVETGFVLAKVQGSRVRPYVVEIRMIPLTKMEWQRILARLNQRPELMAKLLIGEMPEGVAEIFNEEKTPLFPLTEQGLSMDCSCPDDENPCKHTAAVYYIFAQELDRDPFLLFKLRGLNREKLMNTLRKEKKTGIVVPKTKKKKSPPPLDLEHFYQRRRPLTWSLMPTNIVNIPQAGGRIKEMGSPPFWNSENDFESTMGRLYRIVRAHVMGSIRWRKSS